MGKVTESLDSTAVLVDPHTLSRVQLVLCERGRSVDGGVPHVNVGHPHDSPHTTPVSLHVAVHSVRLCSIGDPVVARWGRRVAIKDEMTEGDRSVFRPPPPP